jgi:hypothetical protein
MKLNRTDYLLHVHGRTYHRPHRRRRHLAPIWWILAAGAVAVLYFVFGTGLFSVTWGG